MAKLFSKRDGEASKEAAVSSIPVPPADSALVIDLPEGQKLVLGKMEEGTVIEVATWRGTGRPDSRTNRLMLGVSFGAQSPNESEKSEISEPATAIARYQQVIKDISGQAVTRAKSISKRFVVVLSEITGRVKGGIRSGKGIKDQSSSFEKLTHKSIDSESEFDVDRWLESVRSKSRTRQLDSLSPSKPAGNKGEVRRDKSKSGVGSSRRAGSKRPKGKK